MNLHLNTAVDVNALVLNRLSAFGSHSTAGFGFNKYKFRCTLCLNSGGVYA